MTTKTKLKTDLAAKVALAMQRARDEIGATEEQRIAFMYAEAAMRSVLERELHNEACLCCGVTPALAEARKRVALGVKAKYVSDVLDGAWDDTPAIRKTLSEVRNEQLRQFA